MERSTPIGARVLTACGLLALCVAALALAIAGRPRPASPQPSAPVPAGAGMAGSWQRVGGVAGTSARTSAPFRVGAERWRIRWRVRPRAGVAERYLRIRIDGTHPSDVPIAVSVEANGGEQTGACELFGAGARSLTVLSHHRYEVWAEELRAAGAGDTRQREAANP